MEAIAERGHSAMMWLLGLGLLSAWAAYDEPPKVLETACDIVHGSMLQPKDYNTECDPLLVLPYSQRGPLAAYRHQFLRHDVPDEPFMVRAQLSTMEAIPVESVLTLGRTMIERTENSIRTLSPREFALPGLRQSVSRLETWHAKSGLSASATMLDVRTELASKVQVPGTEHAVDLQQCMGFVGLALVGAYLYLSSLFGTLSRLPRDDQSSDRSWVLLHRAPLGPALLALWLVLPAVAWQCEHILMPIGLREQWPGSGTWLLAAAVAATTLSTLWTALAARRAHLPSSPTQLTIARPASQAA